MCNLLSKILSGGIHFIKNIFSYYRDYGKPGLTNKAYVLTCLNPGTSLAIIHPFLSDLTQVILGRGVPLDWQMTVVPVVFEKSTWLGGSWINTGPDKSACCAKTRLL